MANGLLARNADQRRNAIQKYNLQKNMLRFLLEISVVVRIMKRNFAARPHGRPVLLSLSPHLATLVLASLWIGCGEPLPETYGTYVRERSAYHPIPPETTERSQLRVQTEPVFLVYNKIVESGRDPVDLIQLFSRGFVRSTYQTPEVQSTIRRIARMDELRLQEIELSFRPVEGNGEILEVRTKAALDSGSYSFVVGTRAFAFEVHGEPSSPDLPEVPCFDRIGESFNRCDTLNEEIGRWDEAIQSALDAGFFTDEALASVRAMLVVKPTLDGHESDVRSALLQQAQAAASEKRWRNSLRLVRGGSSIWPDDTNFQDLLRDAQRQQEILLEASRRPSSTVAVFKDVFYYRHWQPTPEGVTVMDTGITWYGRQRKREYEFVWFGDFRPGVAVDVRCYEFSYSPPQVFIYRKGGTSLSRWDVHFSDQEECRGFVDALVTTYNAWRQRFAEIPAGFGPEGGLAVRRR